MVINYNHLTGQTHQVRVALNTLYSKTSKPRRQVEFCPVSFCCWFFCQMCFLIIGQIVLKCHFTSEIGRRGSF